MAPKKSSTNRPPKTSREETENPTQSNVNRHKKSHSTPLRTIDLNTSRNELKIPKMRILDSELINSDSDSDEITELPDIDMTNYKMIYSVKKETPTFSNFKRKSSEGNIFSYILS